MCNSLNKIFVVVKSYGEYDDYITVDICAFASKEEAEKAIEILKKIDEFSKNESKKLKDAVDAFKSQIGYKLFPTRPHKSTIDPQNKISNKDWMKNFIHPYNEEFESASKFNDELDLKIKAFTSGFVANISIPEEFKEFVEEVNIQMNNDSNFEYDINEVKFISIKKQYNLT